MIQKLQPALDWEIVVVDNGSVDDTATVVRDFASHAPVELRCIREPEPGLSAARNRGWRETRGEIIAFLDDDCIPDAEWLQSLLDAYETPEVASVGGRLLPLIERTDRDNIDPAWLAVYTFDAGQVRRDIEILTGANMSFRRSTLERIGGFDEGLGRIGECLLAGDENDLCRAIRREEIGSRILYDPGAVARHKLRAENLSDALLIKRDYCGGITNANLDRKESPFRQFNLLLARTARIAIWILRSARRGVTRSPVNALRDRARRHEFVGYAKERIGGIGLACKSCPMQPERQRRLEQSRAARHSERPSPEES